MIETITDSFELDDLRILRVLVTAEKASMLIAQRAQDIRGTPRFTTLDRLDRKLCKILNAQS